jgi:hypothetical protein
MGASLGGLFVAEGPSISGGVGIGNSGNVLFQAAQWSDTIAGYYEGVIPSSITARTYYGVRAAMYASMIAANTPGMFLTAFMAGLQSATTLIGVGMLPAFVGIPPLTPLLLPAIIGAMAAGQAGAPAVLVYTLMASAIHAWSHTGLAINTVTGITTIWM